MTRRVVVAPPELPLSAAWAVMCREHFRHMPVVANGVLVGILSDRDILLRATDEGGTVVVPDTPVGAVATPSPMVCHSDTDVGELVRLMTEHKVDAVPVVEGQGQLLGLVTSTDLMLLLLRLDEAKVPLPFLFEVEEHRVAGFA